MVWRKPPRKALNRVIVALALVTSFVIFAFAAAPTHTAKAQAASSYYVGTISFSGAANPYKRASPLVTNCLSVRSLNNTVAGTNNFTVSGTVGSGCSDSVDGTLTFTVTATCGSWSGSASAGANFGPLNPGSVTPTLRDSGIAGCAVCDTNGRFLGAPMFTLTMNAQASGFMIHQGGSVSSNTVAGPNRQLLNSSSFSRSLCPFG
jgi:hypothetical protein